MPTERWQERLERADELWEKALPNHQFRSLTTLFAFADRLVKKAPSDMRVLVAWRMLMDRYVPGPDWGSLFRHFMGSDVLSQAEKAELACGCFSTVDLYEVPLPEQLPKTPKQREDWPDWVLLTWGLDRPNDAVRHAAVWLVELGVWTPEEGVERCLEIMAERAGKISTSTYSYRWGDAAGDILLAWRGAFDEPARRKTVKTLCRFSQFKVRRLGYRAGVILFGRAFAEDALEDEARPVREAAHVWLAKGAVDKPPPGLTGMKPYPRG